jgi:general secretion pathway protein C
MKLMNLKTVNLVNAALALAVIPAAAFVARDWLLFSSAPPGAPNGSARPAAARAAADIMAYAPVVESALFPTREKRFRAVPLEAESASSSAVSTEFAGMVLGGTFTGDDSFAVFRRSGSSQEEVVRPGEKVFGTATLLKVLRDSAIVSTGSGEVALRIEEASQGAALPVPARVASQGVKTDFLAASKEVGAGQWVVDRKAVQSALDDIGQVLSDARLTPVVKGGEVQGFHITEIRPTGVFKALGLNNGDILGRVNGYEVTSPERAVQVLTALKGESSIELDIVRGGKPMSLRYEIR